MNNDNYSNDEIHSIVVKAVCNPVMRVGVVNEIPIVLLTSTLQRALDLAVTSTVSLKVYGKHFILIDNGLLDLNEALLHSVLAHEVGHCEFDHPKDFAFMHKPNGVTLPDLSDDKLLTNELQADAVGSWMMGKEVYLNALEEFKVDEFRIDCVKESNVVHTGNLDVRIFKPEDTLINDMNLSELDELLEGNVAISSIIVNEFMDVYVLEKDNFSIGTMIILSLGLLMLFIAIIFRLE